MGPPITGCIARVEPTQIHRQFIKQVRPRWVMIKLHHARRLCENKGYTADDWTGERTEVITTSTINDETLDSLSWRDERDTIQAFEPAYHIPADVSVYHSQPLDDRVECIENHLSGVAFMQSELANYDTEVIPLFKGYTTGERELCLTAAEELGVDMIALYATRYFTGSSGKAHNDLYRNLNRYRKHDMPPTLIIGLLAPSYLKEVPDYILAASGQNQWRKRYTPDGQSVQQQRESFRNLSAAVADALSVPDPNQELSKGESEHGPTEVESTTD